MRIKKMTEKMIEKMIDTNVEKKMIEEARSVKIQDVMSYEEFLEAYLINHEEFLFFYKNLEINLCYGSNGTFSYNICKNEKLIFEAEFNTPYELLENIQIDGYKFPELWDGLE